MGGQEDGEPTLVAEAGDQVEELMADAGVEADRGLVEDQHLGGGDHRACDLEASALAAGECLHGAVDESGEIDLGDEPIERGACVVAGDAPEAGVEREVLATGEFVVEGRVWKTTAEARRASSG